MFEVSMSVNGFGDISRGHRPLLDGEALDFGSCDFQRIPRKSCPNCDSAETRSVPSKCGGRRLNTHRVPEQALNPHSLARTSWNKIA